MLGFSAASAPRPCSLELSWPPPAQHVARATADPQVFAVRPAAAIHAHRAVPGLRRSPSVLHTWLTAADGNGSGGGIGMVGASSGDEEP